MTEAERLGVDDVWSAEAWGHDGVTPLAFMAARTSRIRLGTGILQAGTRTPALLAMTAMSMQGMSDGRFLLGLGVSGPQVIEGWHGIRFDRPVQRMRETVEIVRRAIRGERLEYKGKVYELPLPGGEGKALRSAAPPQPSDADLPGDALAEEPRDDGRDRRRLARHLVHARARGRLHRLAGRRRGPRGPLARRPRPAGGRLRGLRRRRGAADPAAQARPGLQPGRDGLAPAQLLQRRLPPGRLRGRGHRGAAPVARRPARGGDGPRARRAGAPDQPARHRRHGARAPPGLPARRRHHAAGRARRARGSRPGSPPWAACWTSFAPWDSMAVGRAARSTTIPQEPPTWI